MLRLANRLRQLRPPADARVSGESGIFPVRAAYGGVREKDRPGGNRAENRGTEETTVEILASIDDPDDLPEAASAGMGVSAKIYCGKRSLGYVCFNELVAFLQRTVFFWFR